MKEVKLTDYAFKGIEHGEIADLRTLDASDKHRILHAGVDVDSDSASAVFMHMDQSTVHCESRDPGLELLDIKAAMKRYDGLPEYAWKLVPRDKDEFTKNVAENVHGGYFIRTKPGAKIAKPVQSCLFLKAEKAGQNVHNIVVVEEGSELHILTGCSTAHSTTSAAHLGITESFFGVEALDDGFCPGNLWWSDLVPFYKTNLLLNVFLLTLLHAEIVNVSNPGTVGETDLQPYTISLNLCLQDLHV